MDFNQGVIRSRAARPEPITPPWFVGQGGQTVCKVERGSKKQQKRKQNARKQATRPRSDDILALPTGYISRRGRLLELESDAIPKGEGLSTEVNLPRSMTAESNVSPPPSSEDVGGERAVGV